jgi:asparagine synthase (glutamine-hydrolysing)
VKGLLRDAFADYLPDEVLHRKKSPYPKTYNPGYETLLKNSLKSILEDPGQPLNQLVNIPYLNALMNTGSDYGKPWFGQLMAVPQMYAYLIEINFWLHAYTIELNL